MPELSGDAAYADIPPASGYGDKMVDARLAGHSWEDVDQFIGKGTSAALDEGYSQDEIDTHLGLSSWMPRFLADAFHRVSGDEQFADHLKSSTAPLAITPLEDPSAQRVAAYGRIDNLPAVQMPADDKPLQPSGLNLNDEFMRNSYARSLLNDEVRSPREFAERYAGAIAGAGAGSDPGSLVRATGELANSLPSDRDFADTAIATADAAGIGLTPDSVKSIRNNLVSHWADTGQAPLDAYKAAETDPGFAAKLTTPTPPPPPSMLEQFAQADMAEVQQSADMGGWITDRLKDWYSWRMRQPDATQEGWDKAVAEAHETLTTGKISDDAMNVALGFGPASIEGVGAKFGEAIGLLKPLRSMDDLMAAAPPVAPDSARLYRVDVAPGEKPKAPASDNPQPADVQDALRGRWWTDNPQSAQHYLDDPQRGNTVYYVDVPKEEADLYRLSNNPNTFGAEYSGAPDREFVLPESVTERYGGRSVLGSSGTIAGKLGEAIGLLKPREPMVKLLDPAAEGGVAGSIPFSQLFSDKTRTIVDTLSNAADRLGTVAGDLKDRFFNHVGAQLADDIHVGEPQLGGEPITVWHASPHDFDRFDTSKLGTGEGNLGHGAGMHFAENPAVHEYYKKQFTTNLPEGFDIEKLSEDGQTDVGRNPGAAVRRYYEDLKDEQRDAQEAGHSLDADGQKDLDYLSGLTWSEPKPGNSYKVNLHVDPDKLFELDKELSRQPESTQAAVAKLAEEHGLFVTDVETGAKIPYGTGREFYDDLVWKLGSGKEGEIAASQALQKAGFDGTKYRDGESRGKYNDAKAMLDKANEKLADPKVEDVSRTFWQASKEQAQKTISELNSTHNYVIFDDAKMRMVEKNGEPITAADVQRQVENVAQGQAGARGAFDFIGNLLKDESGSLNLFRTPTQQAERSAYTDARDYARPLVIRQRSAGEQDMAHFVSQADHWKTQAGQMVNLFKTLEPHMAEFKAELAKGINGNPMNTMIGNMISYIEGRSMGAALRHDSPLAPVADGIRYINESVRAGLEDAFNRGVINYNSYFEDYFRHMWKDPNKAAMAFDQFQTRIGKLGSSSGLMQRTLPTFEDGIKMGLEPAIANPLELTLFDAAQKVKYLKSAEILKEANTAGYVKWRVSPQGDEVPLNSHRTTKGIPNDPKGQILTAYANPGFANTWNDWLSKGFHERPGATSSIYDKMLYTFNTLNGMKLAVPMFHFMTEVAETTASGMAHSIYLLGSGHPALAAKELALSFPGAQSVQGVYKGGDILREYAGKTINNPALQALVDAGMRFGPRQEIYRHGSAPNMGLSIRRGQLINDVVDDIKNVFGDAKEPMDYRVAQAPGRALGMVAHEVGRVLNTISAPLFDHMIPRIKAFTAVRQMDQFLKDNTLATPEQISKRASQIARNTDERFGEMNMDNTFWPKGVKQSAQLGMISVGWVYGWARMMASAAGLNIERMAFEANPVAIRSLVGFTMAYAMENSLYQYAKTGQAPWSTDTPIRDMFAPRTGGTNQWGTPERALLPSQAKEVVDYFKVAASAVHDPMLGFQAAAEYAQAKGKTPVQFLMALATGKDAIGNDIAHTAGGWSGYIKDMLNPIFYGALNDRKKGTEISPVETMMGLHPMTKAAQDPKAFYDGLYKQDRRLYKQQISRAKHENKIYINPREIPVDPEADDHTGSGGSADVRALEAFRRQRNR